MGGFSPVQQLFSFLVVSFNSQTSNPFFALLPSHFSFVPYFFLLFSFNFCYFFAFSRLYGGSCVISITCTAIVFYSSCCFPLPNPFLTTLRSHFSFIPSFSLLLLHPISFSVSLNDNSANVCSLIPSIISSISSFFSISSISPFLSFSSFFLLI